MKKRVVLASVFLICCFGVAAGNGMRETFRIRGPDSVPSDRQRRPAPKRKTVIAVIDTGLDLAEPAFRRHLWSNPNEVINGQDDDGNGLVDDLNGWDFVTGSPRIVDRHGHGTHVTGLILSLAQNVEILPLRYYAEDLTGQEAMGNSVRALEYAIAADVDIINYSGGGPNASVRERELLRAAEQRGILVVAAAGNDGANTDQSRFYPASYRLNNILAVAAARRDGSLLASSNFGRASVHLAALGDRVVSSLPGGVSGAMTGTSQATAQVTGLAARVILGARMKPSPEMIIETLSSISRYDERLSGRTKSSSWIDESALEIQVNKGASRLEIHDFMNALERETRRFNGERKEAESTVAWGSQ